MGYISHVPALRIAVLRKFSIPFDVGFTHYTTCAAIAAVVTQYVTVSTPKWESDDFKLKKTVGGVSLSTGLDTNFYASMLETCTNNKALKEVLANMFRTGFDQNIIVVTKLVHMATVCSAMEYARLVFDKMPERNVFLWNAIIRGHARNGPFEKAIDLYYEMKRVGILPDRFTFPVVLKACASLSALREGKEVHAQVMRAGFRFDVFVGAALIDMYAKCGCVEDARQVFDEMSWHDSVSWSALIAGYMQNGHANETLSLYYQMQADDVKPDFATIVSVLPACAYLRDLQLGKCIHCYVIKSGFELHVSVGTALVDMYAKCGSTEFAHDLFDKMAERNVISWNAMIDGYAKNGYQNKALLLLEQMQVVGLKPNSVTVVSALLSCADVGSLQQGKSIHAYIIRSGFELDVSVGNSLVFMYARCGSNGIARQLFDKMSVRDVVSWNAMIAGYAQNGYVGKALYLFRKMPGRDVASWNAMIAGYAQNGDHEAALELFYKMQEANIQPDQFTFGSVLASLSSLQHGEGIHKQVIKSGFQSNVIVGSALVDMYGKLGRIEDARRVFDKMSERDVVSWNSMIAGYTHNGFVNEALKLFEKMPGRDVVSWNVMVAGYAQNGCFDEALNLLRQMQLKGMKANSDTFSTILQACANLAALEHGKEAHEDIIRNGFKSDIYVGSGLVNMYAKCGNIEDARRVFDKMLAWNVVSWNAMIIGYAMHGCGKEALQLFEEMQQSGTSPDQVTFVGVLSACCHAGLVDDGRQYFECMSQCYQISPVIEHYCCIVDLLGRAGYLDEAHNFINKMPIKPNAAIWGSLLAACRIHGNTKLGEQAAEHLFELNPENAAPYVLLSNIYAAGNRWDDIGRMRNTMRHRGVMKKPGCSWIEVNKQIHAFLVGH